MASGCRRGLAGGSWGVRWCEGNGSPPWVLGGSGFRGAAPTTTSQVRQIWVSLTQVLGGNNHHDLSAEGPLLLWGQALMLPRFSVCPGCVHGPHSLLAVLSPAPRWDPDPAWAEKCHWFRQGWNAPALGTISAVSNSNGSVTWQSAFKTFQALGEIYRVLGVGKYLLWSRGDSEPRECGTWEGRQHDSSAGKSRTTYLFSAIPLTAKKNEPS